jgi:hypothetical protein
MQSSGVPVCARNGPQSHPSRARTHDHRRNIGLRVGLLEREAARSEWVHNDAGDVYVQHFDVVWDPAGIGFAVQQIAGHATGADGDANFGGSIAVVNAQTAEYHIVVADHGALDPASMPDQIKTPTMNTVQIGFLGV